MRPAWIVRLRSAGSSPLPDSQRPTGTRCCAGRPAIWSSAPTSVISASTPDSSARAVISAPIPRGSPSATAKRGLFLSALSAPSASLRAGFSALSDLLRPDLDVRRLAQPVEITPDGELLAQLVPDAVLHILVPDLTLRPAISHLEHDELVLTTGALHGEDRQHGTRVRIRDGLAVGFRELRNRHRLCLAFGRAVMVEPLERIEGSSCDH